MRQKYLNVHNEIIYATRSVPNERQNVNVVCLYTQRAIANFLRDVQMLISISKRDEHNSESCIAK